MPVLRVGSALARKPWIIAVMMALALFAWIISGSLLSSDQAKQQADSDGAANASRLARVQVERFQAEPVTRAINLYGRTEPDRIATLSAEVSGKVAEVLAARGSFVQAGQALVRLEMNDREQQLLRARKLLTQRQIEFEGSQKLSTKGFQGRANLAKSEADLADAQALVARLELDISNTVVRAPFAGILNERMVERGDYLGIGDPIAVVADIQPLVVRADVTEQHVKMLSLQQSAISRFVNGSERQGQIRYISHVADESSNTFKIEISIDNPEQKLLAGMSAEVTIPLEETLAIKVSPAVLALDEQGQLGIKTVDADSQVLFTPIELVKSEEDGVWLSGFGELANVITRGQGFVRPGDQVDAVYSDAAKR